MSPVKRFCRKRTMVKSELVNLQILALCQYTKKLKVRCKEAYREKQPKKNSCLNLNLNLNLNVCH